MKKYFKVGVFGNPRVLFKRRFSNWRTKDNRNRHNGYYHYYRYCIFLNTKLPHTLVFAKVNLVRIWLVHRLVSQQVRNFIWRMWIILTAWTWPDFFIVRKNGTTQQLWAFWPVSQIYYNTQDIPYKIIIFILNNLRRIYGRAKLGGKVE